MQWRKNGRVYLNGDRYSLCPLCGHYWCSLASKCTSPRCGCVQYLTAEMFHKGEIVVELCLSCLNENSGWLARQDDTVKSPRRLLSNHYHDDDEAKE